MDLLQFANIALGFLGLVAASYTDLRKRTVPNLLVIVLLALAFACHLLAGSLLLMVYGFFLSLIAGLLLYLLGALASGDMKLLIAVGSLVPALPWLSFPFPLLLILATIGVAALHVSLLALRHKDIFRETKGVGELAEGDVPVRRFAVKGGEIREIMPARPMNWLLNPLSSLSGMREMYGMMAGAEHVIGMSADGLSLEEIAELKKLAEQGKIPRELELRRTVPLAPAFLTAFVIVVAVTYYLYGSL